MAISDIFGIIVFLSIIGSTAVILLLLFDKMTRTVLPFWVYIFLMISFIFPVTSSDSVIFYHEPMRNRNFEIAGMVWLIGSVAMTLLLFVKTLIAKRMLMSYTVCLDDRTLALYKEINERVGLRRLPPLLCGNTKEPACVIFTWRSHVVLHNDIMDEMSDNELQTVLTHELLHIKRRHTALRRLLDFICCIHWFNPVLWIGRHEFALACETDCDRSVVKAYGDTLSAIEYAKIMVKLMEVSAARRKPSYMSLGALDFWAAKYRIETLIKKPSKLKRIIGIGACAVIVGFTLWQSVQISKSYFYPFSGSNYSSEWSKSG